MFGGTWEIYGEGKTLIGVDKNNTNFDVVNKIGGSKTNTLAITNLPNHSHSIPSLSGTAKAGTTPSTGGDHSHNFMHVSTPITISFKAGSINSINFIAWEWVQSTAVYGTYFKTTTTGAHTHSVTTNKSATDKIGSDESFTNLQPYIVVRMYKRIS